jgi:hypothetical protein
MVRPEVSLAALRHQIRNQDLNEISELASSISTCLALVFYSVVLGMRPICGFRMRRKIYCTIASRL